MSECLYWLNPILFDAKYLASGLKSQRINIKNFKFSDF